MAKMGKLQDIQKFSKPVSGRVRCLRRHLNFLSLLSEAKTAKQRHRVLQMTSPEHICTVCEHIKNVMQEKVPDITKKIKRFFINIQMQLKN
ncbi:MAG: hypothetical protein GY861_24725 [bacterium]|nr:hypothetical protein [bacterium]